MRGVATKRSADRQGNIAMADENMVQNAVYPNGNDEESEENCVEMDLEVEECNEQGKLFFLYLSKQLSSHESAKIIKKPNSSKLTSSRHWNLKNKYMSELFGNMR